MKDFRVACEPCSNYQPDSLMKAIDATLRHLWPEGMKKIVSPGNRVALKVNMLMGKAPEKNITTHPQFAAAVAKLVMECGGQPFIIDSPGGPYTPGALRLAYERCGFAGIARDLGIDLNYDTQTVTVNSEKGLRIMSAEMLRPAIEADVIINLPKLKTHGLTTMTCAVKNIFGLIPGMQKIEYHMRSPDVDDFCGMLVDVAELASPELTIVDAVMAMEGEGPSGGEAKPVQLIFAGTNMHAVDMLAASIMDLKPQDVPTLKLAQAAGMAPFTIGEMTIVGHQAKPMPFVPSSASIRTHILDQFLPRGVADRVSEVLRPKPAFDESLCNQCGVCVRSCPPTALLLEQGRQKTPSLKAKECIRCFCCQELCPQHAITVKRSFLGRVLFR